MANNPEDGEGCFCSYTSRSIEILKVEVLSGRLPGRLPDSQIPGVVSHRGQVHGGMGVHLVQLCAYREEKRDADK